MLSYIETHLEEKIEYKELSKFLGTNEYTMQSIFSFLTGMNLSDYIRRRRLSNAGFDVYHTQEKIVDIAVKYQYESATSFSRAFEKFHGMKPSEAKTNPQNLKVFARITFDETMQIENQNIAYSIIEQEELVLYGKGIPTTESTIGKDAPKFYIDMNNQFYEIYGTDIPYGMTVYEKRFESDYMEYWVLYDKPMPGFQKYVIPKGKWLLFHIPSYEAKDIQKVTHEVYEKFLPSCQYNLRPIPELEHYYEGITDFLIPIEDETKN